MSNFKIDKDNYKGYIELYKTRKLIEKKLYNILCIQTVFTMFFGIGTACFLAYLSNFNIIVTCVSIVYGAAISFLAPTLSWNHTIKKQGKALKNEYPYVDLNVSTIDLEEELEKQNILRIEKHDGYPVAKLYVEEYENYLKCEEIKKEVFNEFKYSDLIVPKEISDKELEKTKVKVKKYVTK